MKKAKPVDTQLSQSEADRLIEMPKHYDGTKHVDFPRNGKELQFSVFSADKRDKFLLNINSKSITVKYTFQNRFHDTIVLVRVDIQPGSRHWNPDNTLVVGNHLHRYRAGFGDKWAAPLPAEFGTTNNIFELCQHFLDYCNVETKPVFNQSLLNDGND